MVENRMYCDRPEQWAIANLHSLPHQWAGHDMRNRPFLLAKYAVSDVDGQIPQTYLKGSFVE